MEQICKNCRHARTIEVIEATGFRRTQYFCKASRNFAMRNETDSFRRYHYDEKKVFDF